MRKRSRPGSGVRCSLLAVAALAAVTLTAGCSSAGSGNREYQDGVVYATRNLHTYQSWIQSPADWCKSASLARLKAPDQTAFDQSLQFADGCMTVLRNDGV